MFGIEKVVLIVAVLVVAVVAFVVSCIANDQPQPGKSSAGTRPSRAKAFPDLAMRTPMDYANWLRGGDGPRGYHKGSSSYDGQFHADDEDRKVRGLVNNALLYLAFGPKEPAWKDNSANGGAFTSMTAKQAYHDQFMWLRKTRYGWPDNGDRKLADAVESYVYMRDAGIFTLVEQKRLEDWFSGLTPDRSRQFIKEGWYALLGYVLDTTKTGKDYSAVVNEKWKVAKRVLYFNRTFGPIENSAHYNAYIFKSMLRISLYIDKRAGKRKNIPASEKANIKKAVEWILDVYPHNGYGLSFGNEWLGEQVRGLHDFLLGASYILNDGVPKNVKMARKAKWLAARMFRYLHNHHAAADYFKEPPRYECNPMWAWRYCDKSLPELEPTISEHGSKKVYGEMGDSYNSSNPHVLKLDKVVHRDGWGENSFYLYLDMAPSSGKNAPYANAIWNVIYGDDVFCPGHKREQNNAGNQRTWEDLNVVTPHKGDSVDGECVFLHDFASHSVSKTREGKWDRYISFPKNNSYAVVFDFAPAIGTAYWHFVSKPAPVWRKDSVKLTGRKHRLLVYYPNNHKWYSVTHSDRHTWNKFDGRKRIWVVDDPSRELILSGARTWATVLHPDRKVMPTSVTAINPSGAYPNAVGVKLIYPGYTDWNGARHVEGVFTYDQVTTDAEIFWGREDSAKWTVSFVNGKRLSISLAVSPASVILNGSEIRTWTYSKGTLSITPGKRKGTIEVIKARPARR